MPPTQGEPCRAGGWAGWPSGRRGTIDGSKAPRNIAYSEQLNSLSLTLSYLAAVPTTGTMTALTYSLHFYLLCAVVL